MDAHAPRNGRVIEELGYYDPMVKETDARAVLNGERVAYWLGVGALPSDNVRVLIKKYGKDGTHLDMQKAALERLKTLKPMAPPPQRVPAPKKAEETQAEEAANAETPSAAEPTDDTAGSE